MLLVELVVIDFYEQLHINLHVDRYEVMASKKISFYSKCSNQEKNRQFILSLVLRVIEYMNFASGSK
jgi:hypothetical protein